MGGGERIHKAGAHRRHVKCGAAGHAQLVLHNGGGGGKLHIGRGGGHHNQVDIFGGQAGIIQRPAGGGHSQIAGLLVIGGNVAEFDAGAAGDPFIRSIDFLSQLIVAHTVSRQIAAGAENFSVFHGTAFWLAS